jgi:hypothetical protein
MSTKTLLKRLALGTVVAVGAGTLSLVTVSSANAGTEAATLAVIANGASGSSASSPASAGLLTGAQVAAKSVTITATMLSSGALALTSGSAHGKQDFVVTGGYISSAAGTDYLNSDGTQATVNGTSAATVVVKPSSGSSSITVQLFDDATLASPAPYTVTTQGALSSQIIVTVVSSSASGAFSSAKSLINTSVVLAKSTADGTDKANVNSGSVSTIPNGESGYVAFNLKDAYDAALSSGAVIATVTTGAKVAFSTNTAKGTTDVQTGNTGYITVSQAVANTPVSATVSISYNGTTVTSRTFNFLGEVAKVVASNPRVVSTTEPDPSKSGNASFIARYYDSAGNELWPSDAIAQTTPTSAVGDQVISASNVAIYHTGTSGDATWPYTAGKVTGASKGSSSLQLQYVNATSGTIIKSNTWTQSVAGDADSYTAKFDKASYTPGSVATLTITFKDSKGNLANHLINKITAAGETITIAGAPGTLVSAPATSDVAGGGSDAAGTVSYQFTVSQAAGSYSAIVDAPTVDKKSGTAQTVAYSVASGSVSLEDVLKGIVSLIASINKQIAALAKLVAPAKKK